MAGLLTTCSTSSGLSYTDLWSVSLSHVADCCILLINASRGKVKCHFQTEDTCLFLISVTKNNGANNYSLICIKNVFYEKTNLHY